MGREVKSGYITPEVIIQKKNDCVVVLPHALNSCSIDLTPGYREILAQATTPTEKQYLTDQLSELRSIQYGVLQRQNTIARITEEIVRIQNDFFMGKSTFLQPLSLEDMANAIGVVPSTVSRAIQGKYLICPSGTFPYKFFFSRKLPSSQKDMPQSTSMLIQAIKTCIEEENPEAPWSDQQICEILKKNGIHIARRTVSKYREKLGIPVTYLRKIVSYNSFTCRDESIQ